MMICRAVSPAGRSASNPVFTNRDSVDLKRTQVFLSKETGEPEGFLELEGLH